MLDAILVLALPFAVLALGTRSLSGLPALRSARRALAIAAGLVVADPLSLAALEVASGRS